MEYQTYVNQIKSLFAGTQTIMIDNKNTTVTYEEVFKWAWMATKLKIFSFVTYTEAISRDILMNYSSACLDYARKNKKGLPLGFQNGIVCNNILVSESINDDAITFIASRPRKHYCIFEIPIVYDLARNDLHYYKGEIIWGMMYNDFIKNYIMTKFGMNT